MVCTFSARGTQWNQEFILKVHTKHTAIESYSVIFWQTSRELFFFMFASKVCPSRRFDNTGLYSKQQPISTDCSSAAYSIQNLQRSFPLGSITQVHFKAVLLLLRHASVSSTDNTKHISWCHLDRNVTIVAHENEARKIKPRSCLVTKTSPTLFLGLIICSHYIGCKLFKTAQYSHKAAKKLTHSDFMVQQALLFNWPLRKLEQIIHGGGR